MGIYLIGSILSFLPMRWRKAFAFMGGQWRPATILSGFLESIGALIAISLWYTHAMNAWTTHAVDAALNGKLGPGVTPEQIGTVAFSVWALHPLTIILAYAGVEGAIRLCAAAFSDQALGTLPLFLLDYLLPGARIRQKQEDHGNESKMASAVAALRERAIVSRTPIVGDELCFRIADGNDILEVRACRRKEDWDPARIVRHEDSYYRIETSSVAGGPRPFCYVLHRLSKGVASRTVILYSPVDPVIRTAPQMPKVKARV